MSQVIVNKIANIERCLQRIKEEYVGHEKEIDVNYTKQDAVILNLQRPVKLLSTWVLIWSRQKSLVFLRQVAKYLIYFCSIT